MDTKPTERKMMENWAFSAEKRTFKIKAGHCRNGSTQHQWMDDGQESSPTAMAESDANCSNH